MKFIKNRIFFLLLLCIPAGAIKIPGVYNCKSVRVTRTEGGEVFRKGFSAPSLALDFKPGILKISGTQSDYYLSESFSIRRVSTDTLIAEVIYEDKNEPVTMVFRGDTLTINYTYENEDSDTVLIDVELLLIPAVDENTGPGPRKRPGEKSDARPPVNRNLLGR